MSFFKYLIFLVSVLILWSCKEQNRLVLDLPNQAPGDSVFVNVFHERSGKLVFADTNVYGALNINLKKLPADIYILKVGWPKQLVSPAELRLMRRNPSIQERPSFVFQKFLFLDRKNRAIDVRFEDVHSLQELEDSYYEDLPYLRLISNSDRTNGYEGFERELFLMQENYQYEARLLKNNIAAMVASGQMDSAQALTQHLNKGLKAEYVEMGGSLKSRYITAHPECSSSTYLLSTLIVDAASFIKYKPLYHGLYGQALSSSYIQYIENNKNRHY